MQLVDHSRALSVPGPVTAVSYKAGLLLTQTLSTRAGLCPSGAYCIPGCEAGNFDKSFRTLFLYIISPERLSR